MNFDAHKIEKKLGIVFNNKDILKQAFSHSSFVVEKGLSSLSSNERLEFLGDAVLEIVVSDNLYKEYPKAEEGILTQWRSVIVNTNSLAEVFRKLGLSEYILLSKGEAMSGGQEKETILANMTEGLIGAIYLDLGFDKAYGFIKSFILKDKIELIEEFRVYNPKGGLQERVQAQGKGTPNYKMIKENGPDHEKNFEIGVYIDGKLIAFGSGNSKKNAEEDAARRALELMNKEQGTKNNGKI